MTALRVGMRVRHRDGREGVVAVVLRSMPMCHIDWNGREPGLNALTRNADLTPLTPEGEEAERG